VQDAHRAQAQLVDNVRELRNRVREIKLFPEATFRAISAMQQRLLEVLRGEARLLRDADPQRRRGQLREAHLQPLRADNQRQIAELERDALLLADLLHEQQLQGLVALAQELAEGRRRLAALLERYRKTRRGDLRQELRREIGHMREQLRQLLSQAARLATVIPDEYLNAEAIRSERLDETLAKLSSVLRRSDLGGSRPHWPLSTEASSSSRVCSPATSRPIAGVG